MVQYGDLITDLSENPTKTVAHLLNSKNRAYAFRAWAYCVLYYSLRLTAGLGAALLPFTVGTEQKSWSVILSLAVAVATVVDTVFSPRERWRLYSDASDRLAIAVARRLENFEDHEEALRVILETESAGARATHDIDRVIERAKQAAQTAATGDPASRSN